MVEVQRWSLLGVGSGPLNVGDMAPVLPLSKRQPRIPWRLWRVAIEQLCQREDRESEEVAEVEESLEDEVREDRSIQKALVGWKY